MGRRKIDIALINDDRIKKVTLKKRRIGLLKKAIQLSKLTEAQIYLKIYCPQEKVLLEYISKEQDPIFSLNQQSAEVNFYVKYYNEDYGKFTKKQFQQTQSNKVHDSDERNSDNISQDISDDSSDKEQKSIIPKTKKRIQKCMKVTQLEQRKTSIFSDAKKSINEFTEVSNSIHTGYKTSQQVSTHCVDTQPDATHSKTVSQKTPDTTFQMPVSQASVEQQDKIDDLRSILEQLKNKQLLKPLQKPILINKTYSDYTKPQGVNNNFPMSSLVSNKNQQIKHLQEQEHINIASVQDVIRGVLVGHHNGFLNDNNMQDQSVVKKRLLSQINKEHLQSVDSSQLYAKRQCDQFSMNEKFIQAPVLRDLRSFESPYVKNELYNKQAGLDSNSRGKNSVLNSSDRYLNVEHLQNDFQIHNLDNLFGAQKIADNHQKQLFLGPMLHNTTVQPQIFPKLSSAISMNENLQNLQNKEKPGYQTRDPSFLIQLLKNQNQIQQSSMDQIARMFNLQ